MTRGDIGNYLGFNSRNHQAAYWKLSKLGVISVKSNITTNDLNGLIELTGTNKTKIH